jgi:hypothetical protein
MNEPRIPTIFNGEHCTADQSEPVCELLAQVLAELRGLRADLGTKAPRQSDDDDVVNASEVRRLLGWSRSVWSRRRAASEVIPPTTGKGRLERWRRADVLSWRDSGLSAREWMTRRRAAKR